MTEQQREHLSALADDELDADLVQPTVSALESNPELAATWERYHLVGSALRREAVRPEYRGVAPGVHERLDAEPAVLAPSGARRGRGVSRAGPFIGVGLAAGAAFFAVFALPQLFEPSPRATSRTPPLASVSLPQQFQLNASGQRWHLDRPALERKLDRFLVNHQARSPVSEIKGFIPYATVVGYAADR